MPTRKGSLVAKQSRMPKNLNANSAIGDLSITELRQTFQRGFTLVELMVVLTITAILLGLAVPSFKRMIQSSTISSNVNTFLADMRFARSEAIRLGGAVVMCRSDAPEANTPTCGATGSGPGGNGWVSGWIVFQDLDNNGDRAAADPLLRVQAPITSLDSIGYDSSLSTKIRFTATGRLIDLSSGAAELQFGGGNYVSDIRRVVCISLSGRARIAGDGNTSCDTDR
jgi:type IV fimbrial biogenesis protein FimT